MSNIAIAASVKNSLKTIKKFIKQVTINTLCMFTNAITAKKTWYRLVTGKYLDLDNPKSLADKVCWLEFFWQDQRVVDLSDKYEVRNYVASCGLEEILVPLIGVYDKVDDIPFDQLPEQFALKCNHGCAYNIICKDKKHINWKKTKKKLNHWMKTKYGNYALELHYNAIKPRIICEKYLEQLGDKGLIDYKFYCFNGKPAFTLVCFNRERGLKLQCYDNNWNHLDYVIGSMKSDVQIPKPQYLNRMLEIAQILSKPFPFVRVDLYEVDGKIYFSEMTFSPNTGMFTYYNDEMLIKYGELLKLPEPTNEHIWF
ncbi:MAG: ATP-grasp fold amidoligase family protein [Bacillota bacterium]|jgi:hypothetical protein